MKTHNAVTLFPLSRLTYLERLNEYTDPPRPNSYWSLNRSMLLVQESTLNFLISLKAVTLDYKWYISICINYNVQQETHFCYIPVFRYFPSRNWPFRSDGWRKELLSYFYKKYKINHIKNIKKYKVVYSFINCKILNLKAFKISIRLAYLWASQYRYEGNCIAWTRAIS